MSSGAFGCWAQKSGDFRAKEFEGTQAGLEAALAYAGTGGNGMVTLFPGNGGVTIPTGVNAIPAGVQLEVFEGGRRKLYNSSHDLFNANRMDPILNVKDFDTFQAAHDALPSTGGSIYIPAGSYSHSTKPAWGSGSTAGMVITKDFVNVFGEGTVSSNLRNFASGAKNQHGFDIRSNVVTIKHLSIDGPNDGAGTGSHIVWQKPAATTTNLILEDLYLDRSSSWSVKCVADYAQFLGKLIMDKCTMGNAMSNGDLYLCNVTNNMRMKDCEFTSKGYNSMRMLGVSAAGTQITVATSSPHLSRTDANGGLAMLAVGDEVSGIGIKPGSKIASLSTGGATDTADLDIAPAAAGTRTLGFMRPGGGGTGFLPTGAVHIQGGVNFHFDGCSWQGVTASTGLSVLGAADVFIEQCYREYGSPYTGQLPFLTLFGNVENVQLNKFFFQSNSADPLLFESGDLTGFFTTAQNVRLRGVHILTNQNPPTLTNVVKVGSASDDVELEDCQSVSSATGARFPLIISGTGAGLLAVASVAGTMTLPSPTARYFSVTGTNTITSITAQTRGRVVTLVTSSTAGLTDGSNLKLAGNFTGATDRSITLLSDGTNWIEIGRGVN